MIALSNTLALMTTQRSVAYVVLTIVVLGGVGLVLAQMRSGRAELGSEIELAANRKEYLPDEELEGPKLNKALWTAFGLLVIVALSLLVWWIDTDMPCSAEDLFKLEMRLIEPGLSAVLGVPALNFASHSSGSNSTPTGLTAK